MCARILFIMMSCVFFVDMGECFRLGVKSPYVTNGETAGRNQIPYQAAIFADSGQKTFFCGGSLISEEWVLTAAHCAEGVVEFTVILGAHHLPNRNESGRQTFLVHSSSAYLHPEWSRSKLLNDIALLKLPTKAKFDENVQVIKLTNGEAALEKSGNPAIFSGWGRFKDGKKGTAEYLQYAEQPVISNRKCASFYFLVIKSSHICTSGFNGKSTCQGDSGGPLITVDDAGIARQIGIVSFGTSLGCELGWPPVFTRISKHLDFIKEVTRIIPA